LLGSILSFKIKQMKSATVILSLILIASLAAVEARSLYDHSKSYVTLITSLNF